MSIEFNLDAIYSVLSWVDQNLLTPLIVIASGVLTVMVVMRWSYAFDSLPWIAGMDVRSEIVPWEGATKEILPTFGLVKHTRIQNQSPSTIAKWIRKQQKIQSDESDD